MILTCNRHAFFDLALEAVWQQDYPFIEIVAVDDGPEPLRASELQMQRAAEQRGGRRRLPIRLVRLDARATIGTKRNAALRRARGEVIIHWDDDDMHPPSQVSELACPILRNETDLTAPTFSYIAQLSSREASFTRVAAELSFDPSAAPFLGAMAYSRRVAEVVAGKSSRGTSPFADVSLSEDLEFVRHALSSCFRMLPIPGLPLVYVRHGGSGVTNTWRVGRNSTYGERLLGGTPVDAPPFLSPRLRARYVAAEADAAARDVCMPLRRWEPAGLHSLRVHHPFMPARCCDGRPQPRPCPAAQQRLDGCGGVSFCGVRKGTCTSSCTCPSDEAHGQEYTKACGAMCCQYWRRYWSSAQHRTANCGTPARRPLKRLYCRGGSAASPIGPQTAGQAQSVAGTLVSAPVATAPPSASEAVEHQPSNPRSCGTLSRGAAPFVWAGEPPPPPHAPAARRLRMLRNVWVSAEGWIVERRTCWAVRNGGCFDRAPREWRPPEQPPSPTAHPCAVTLATHFGDANYHFPIEALVGLSALDNPEGEALLRRCALHVTRRKPYVDMWLAAILPRALVGIGATPRRSAAATAANGANAQPADVRVPLINGTVAVDELHVPELGRCKRPHRDHIRWLRTRVLSFVERNSTAAPRAPDSLLLVERTGIIYEKRASGYFPKVLHMPSQIARRRLLTNFDEAVRRPAAAYAASHGLQLVVHSDVALPPLWHQLRRFADARVIVAPLGAAEVGLLAARAGACLVELQEETYVPLDAVPGGRKKLSASRAAQEQAANTSRSALAHNDTTYKTMAHILGQRYVRVTTRDFKADAAAVSSGLASCRVRNLQ